MNGAKLSLVIDVDGVLSTGQFLYSAEGKEYKVFGPHDNDGLKMLRDLVDITFITADVRGLPITKRRLDDMGFGLEVVPESDRYEFVKNRFGFDRTIFIGDGIFDAPIMRDCRIGIAPANARPEAKAVADFVTPSKAGEGAVCDACIWILENVIRRAQ